MGVVAWQVRRTALDTRSAAAVWKAKGLDAVKHALGSEFDEKTGQAAADALYLRFVQSGTVIQTNKIVKE